jgi:hypothetical protein
MDGSAAYRCCSCAGWRALLAATALPLVLALLPAAGARCCCCRRAVCCCRKLRHCPLARIGKLFVLDAYPLVSEALASTSALVGWLPGTQTSAKEPANEV